VDNDEAFHYYTGVESHRVFVMILDVIQANTDIHQITMDLTRQSVSKTNSSSRW
jgi:hypothetical protein